MSTLTVDLVLGSHNKKKIIELNHLLEPYGLRAASLASYDNAIQVIEDGDSFAANAQKKASHQAAHLRAWTLGEDSGLMVDALDGAPGIFTARFAGADADDEQNNDLLLEKLTNVPREKRTAYYVSHVSLSDPDGSIRLDHEAVCRGLIRTARAGTGGFGYDPLFEVREYSRTFAELGANVKSVLSHRSRAMRAILPQLAQLVRG